MPFIIPTLARELKSGLFSLAANDLASWKKARSIKAEFISAVFKGQPLTALDEVYVGRNRNGVYLGVDTRTFTTTPWESYCPKPEVPNEYKGIPVRQGWAIML
jgi:hypothetical protein